MYVPFRSGAPTPVRRPVYCYAWGTVLCEFPKIDCNYFVGDIGCIFWPLESDCLKSNPGSGSCDPRYEHLCALVSLSVKCKMK